MTRVVGLLLFLCWLTPLPLDARDVQSELRQLQKERQELAAERRALEARLGDLHRQLRELDRAWVRARKALRQVEEEKAQVDARIGHLRRRMESLASQVSTLRQRMRQEASVVWRFAGREPSWLDVLAGVPVTEIPHRRYLIARLMQQQEEDRKALQRSVQALILAEEDLKQQQQRLALLRKEKRSAERKARQRLQAKRDLAQRVRKDVKLKKMRDATLALQEKGLQRLLQRIRQQAEARKRAAARQGKALAASSYTIKGHIRRHKGKIPWPVRGRLVARYGARLDQNRPKLKGVLIAPASRSKKGRQVHAIADGIVRYADWFGGFGLMMIVEHSDGIMSIYAHNDNLYKKIGERVRAGEVLSDAGSTGWVEHVRLYFEMRDRGKPINPERWCRG